MTTKRLTDKVLEFDQEEIRFLHVGEQLKEIDRLLSLVEKYISKRNGSLPLPHEVVYGLRIAAEVAGEGVTLLRVPFLMEKYNRRVDRGSHIEEIPIYKDDQIVGHYKL